MTSFFLGCGGRTLLECPAMSAILRPLSCVALAALFVAPGAWCGEAAQVTLESHTGVTWRVEFETRAGFSELRLIRTPNDARLTRWKTVSSGIELVHRDGEDRIRHRDGDAFSTAAFKLEAGYIPLPKEYAPFSPFGDGGLLIYSGRFHACGGGCPRDDTGDEGPWAFTLTPPPGAHVIVNGTVHTGTVQWMDEGNGTNIYVGTASPIESPYFIGIIDQTLPVEIQARLNELFPRLMDYFAGRLQLPPEKPMLFVSYEPDYASGWGRQGGTLPNQVFMHFYGPAWENEQESDWDAAASVAWFFGHEAGHLFQGGFTDDEDAWIHEGTAEAFALLALRDLEAAPPDYLDGRVRDAVDQCVQGLEAGPLKDAAKEGRFGDYYSCGLLMQLAVDASARRASDATRTLFDVWMSFRARVDAGAEPDRETFLAVVTEASDPETAAFLRTLATERQSDPEKTLRTGLEAHGPTIAH